MAYYVMERFGWMLLGPKGKQDVAKETAGQDTVNVFTQCICKTWFLSHVLAAGVVYCSQSPDTPTLCLMDGQFVGGVACGTAIEGPVSTDIHPETIYPSLGCFNFLHSSIKSEVSSHCTKSSSKFEHKTTQSLCFPTTPCSPFWAEFGLPHYEHKIGRYRQEDQSDGDPSFADGGIHPEPWTVLFLEFGVLCKPSVRHFGAWHA